MYFSQKLITNKAFLKTDDLSSTTMMNTTTISIPTSLESLLTRLTIYTTIYGGIFILAAGNLGCVGNILVYRSQTYRHQACFIYLFWETIASLFILNCILLTRILETGFNVSLMNESNAFCRIREFISMVMYQSENTLFLCATLDRILSAQRSKKLRQWSNQVPLAYKIIVANFVLWIAVSSHRLVFYGNGSGHCDSQEGFYAAFDHYQDVSLSAIASPLLVIVLAVLLRCTVRSVNQRRATLKTQGNLQETDSQLTIMLLLQSILAIINYVPYGVYILYSMFTKEWVKSSWRVAWEQLIIAFIRLSSYVFAAGTFYVSMVSNPSFRKEFFKIFGIQRGRIALVHTKAVGNIVNIRTVAP
ncbi:unnamed protein product [Adineta ricciae]|uniref:G-protein coupled receptors family 1 profile domain-containing protein n=1 Tax=Adineta ricciae TaxID=249248 RepID=A0A815VWJ2_ADIRI|nr:unnamed protein product [Adineta ricciae]CAF1541942.1 unnamed protein product [Adineta ricciae]